MICGSANANERSMRGEGGDSEIAILNRPESGYELICQEKIILQRRKSLEVTYGRDFVTNYPGCYENPALYANQMRKKALENLDNFYLNVQSQSSLLNSSPIMTWPFNYSNEVGHIGEYTQGRQNLIDTPSGMENLDHFL